MDGSESARARVRYAGTWIGGDRAAKLDRVPGAIASSRARSGPSPTTTRRAGTSRQSATRRSSPFSSDSRAEEEEVLPRPLPPWLQRRRSWA